MSVIGDQEKTKDQLIAELEILRAEVQRLKQHQEKELVPSADLPGQGFSPRSHPTPDLYSDVFARTNRAKVLVVEDDPDMRQFLVERLAPEYEMLAAADGQEGWELAVSHRPDLILCDMLLPKLNGDQLVERIRAYPELNQIPIILLSALNDYALRIRLLQSGAQDCLAKPFLVEELQARVKSLVTTKRLQEDLQRELYQHQQTEIELQAQKEILKLVLDNIPQQIFWKDINSVYLGGNQLWAKAAGFDSPDEVVGKTDYDLPWEKELADYYYLQDRRIMQTDRAELNVIEQKRQASGQFLWVNVNKMPMHDAKGRVIGILGTIEDITERRQVEMALRQSEAQNRALLDAVPDLMIRMDGNGTYLDVRPAKNFTTVLTGESIRGKNIYEVMPPEVADCRMHYVQQALETEVIQTYEFDLTIDGELRSEEARIVVCGENEVLAIIRDVTQRKRAETERNRAEVALKESERQIRLITDALPVIIAYVDTDLHYRFNNQTYSRWMGCGCESVYGKHVKEVVGDVLFERLTPYIALALAGQEVTFENMLVGKDGTKRDVTVSYIPDIREQGEVKGFVVLINDITQRKRDEAELKKLNEQLEVRVQERTRELMQAQAVLHQRQQEFVALVENAPEIIARFDPDLRHLYINPAIEAISGISPSLFVGKTNRELGFPEDVVTLMEASGRQVFETGQAKMIEISFPAAMGMRYYQSRIVPEFAPDGTVGSLLTVSSDITALKQIETQLKASLLEKEVLLKEIHHRVKNNLQVISSLLKLQTGYIKDSKILEVFKESQNRVRAMALIHEKLYQSRDLARADFANYIRKLVSDLFYSYAVSRHDIDLKINVDEIQLDIDIAIPCGLIINELVCNALKYAFPNKRKGELYIGLASSSSQHYVLTIQDNGIGLPDAVDFNHTESLGLRLVCLLTQQLHGEVALKRDQGTTFTITFLNKSSCAIAADSEILSS